MTYLQGIPVGQYYFEVAVLLRNSLLVSSMLCNSEAWYNMTVAEYDYLETVDVMLMRNILNAPQATQKEMLYLELGCLPFRHIIKNRRLSFLHYLLKEDPQSMVHRFLRTQIENRNTKDWTTTVLKDIEELDIKAAKAAKQTTFSSLIGKNINVNA